MNESRVIEMDIECPDCKGTGLYVGVCERDGAAVVCIKCKGTGSFHYKFEYKEFAGERKHRENVKRVFGGSHGFIHSAEDVTTKEGKKIEFSKAGVAYEDWLNGVKPMPVKELYCPLLWCWQEHSVSYCGEYSGLGGHIPSCKMPDKSKCWAEYEERFKDW